MKDFEYPFEEMAQWMLRRSHRSMVAMVTPPPRRLDSPGARPCHGSLYPKMKVLAIETSCDETAVAILEASGDEQSASFKVLGNALLSQVEQHRPYGGVYPMLAKREHLKNLPPLLTKAFEEAGISQQEIDAVAV